MVQFIKGFEHAISNYRILLVVFSESPETHFHSPKLAVQLFYAPKSHLDPSHVMPKTGNLLRNILVNCSTDDAE
jgi:hypothetical protein